MTDSQVYQECRLCPRQCAVDRTNGIGLCGVPASLMVSKAMLHYWEEPCLSGKNGSGAVFFSGCGLGCVFCQNRDISEGKSGLFITEERLTDIFLELEQKGAQNINLVTAVQYTPSVIAALDAARKKGVTVPVVDNSGG
ncbi:MAG: 4Fe-4S cluster-binding domain-containing protein [Clostridia bacterium]|nr:4Fe-4S cluster-binding domain-containing protein [Clostridia bacterium]